MNLYEKAALSMSLILSKDEKKSFREVYAEFASQYSRGFINILLILVASNRNNPKSAYYEELRALVSDCEYQMIVRYIRGLGCATQAEI